jgi:hypothetical protein
MLDLSEELREYVDEACPTVTLNEIERKRGRPPEERTSGQGPRRDRRTVGLLGAAAVVILAVVLVVQLLPGSGSSPGSDAEAALAHAARVAAARPAVSSPGPGRFLYYMTTQTMQGSTPKSAAAHPFLFEETQTTQTWVAHDGSGRQRIVRGQPELVSPDQKSAWMAAGSPRALLPVPGITDTRYPSRLPPDGGPFVTAHGEYFLSYLDSSKFPTQPAALQQYMDRYFEIAGGPTTTFLLAGNVLQVGANPALRSAIFGLIEHLRGVTLLGPTKDPSGRSGTGVAIDGDGTQYILVFNPTTSAVLGEKFVSTKSVNFGGLVTPKGTLVGSTTFGTTGVSSSTSTLPGGRPAPPFQANPEVGTARETQFSGSQG